jgi:hypothetical protein
MKINIWIEGINYEFLMGFWGSMKDYDSFRRLIRCGGCHCGGPCSRMEEEEKR